MANNNKISQWSLTLLRVVLGFIFAYHGYLKLFAPNGFKQIVGLLGSLGFPPPINIYAGLIVSVVEFAGGLLLILGVLTRWSSVLLIIDMLVAFFMVHLKKGFSVYEGGYEFVIILLAGLVVVLASGPGKIAVGKMLFKSKKWQ